MAYDLDRRGSSRIPASATRLPRFEIEQRGLTQSRGVSSVTRSMCAVVSYREYESVLDTDHARLRAGEVPGGQTAGRAVVFSTVCRCAGYWRSSTLTSPTPIQANNDDNLVQHSQPALSEHAILDHGVSVEVEEEEESLQTL